MSFLMPTQYGDGDQYFYQDTISRWFTILFSSKLKNNSPTYDMETIPRPDLKYLGSVQYLQKVQFLQRKDS